MGARSLAAALARPPVICQPEPTSFLYTGQFEPLRLLAQQGAGDAAHPTPNASMEPLRGRHCRLLGMAAEYVVV